MEGLYEHLITKKTILQESIWQFTHWLDVKGVHVDGCTKECLLKFTGWADETLEDKVWDLE